MVGMYGIAEMVFPAILIFCYWQLLFHLIDQVIREPKLNKRYRIPMGLVNVVIPFVLSSMVDLPNMFFISMFMLMLVDFWLLFRSPFAQNVFCALACIIHVFILRAVVIGLFSMATGASVYQTATTSSQQGLWFSCLFFCLDIFILLVLKLIPMNQVHIISQHKEPRFFLSIWMMINTAYLFYHSDIFYQPQTYRHLAGEQVAVPFIILLGLYVVTLFAVKVVSLLDYKEKSDELTQAMLQEQQYRHSIMKDALVSYTVNVTQNRMVQGLETLRTELGGTLDRYSDVLTVMASKFIHSEDIKEFRKYAVPAHLLREFERGKSETIAEYRRKAETGEYIWVRSVTNLLKDMETGDLIAYVCVKDIDAEKNRQLDLQRMAERDPLTGLYNKELTGKLINESFMGSHQGESGALLMIDVDHFKSINDHLGHLYGDAVLCELGDKLRTIFSSNDVVGRIGGDEFMVYLPNSPSLKVVQQRAEDICKAFYMTYNGVKGEQYTISGSVGISLFPNHGLRFEELYAHADGALYQAKREGKNRYCLYDGGDFQGYESNRTEIQSDRTIPQKSFRENRIEYIFKILYQSENSVEAIYSVLELVAGHFSFERGYIFETDSDGQTTSNTFEWCAEGVTPEIGNLQKVTIEAVETANAHFYQTGIFILKTLDELKPIERAMLEPQGIKSMFQFGIFDKHCLLGFIGFDNCSQEVVPDRGEIDELATICNILATFFVKQRNDEMATKDFRLRQEVMNHLNNYVYVIDPHSFQVLFMNGQMDRQIVPKREGVPCYELFRGNDRPCADCPVKELQSQGTKQAYGELYNEKLGQWLETTISEIHWEDRDYAYLVECADITKQKEENLAHIKQLESLAYVDELTGSRTYYKFKKDAQAILQKEWDISHFLVKFDMDNFKMVNQIYGYERGNEILRCVAKAMEQTVRSENEIFARVSNDEFIALFAVKDSSEADGLYKEFFGHFMTLLTSDFSFQCRFPRGVCIIAPEDVQSLDVEDLFEKTNMAHKTAKLDPSKNFAIYDESMTKRALRTREIENKMEEGLQKHEFTVYLQPKYHLTTGLIGGAEALVRWENENTDLFSPDSFIPIFERNGFITKLDMEVLRQVCLVIRRWMEEGIQPVAVSVNFSKLHLSDDRFVKKLCEMVDGMGIDRKYIEIEITETVIYDNIDTLAVLLADLHRHGFVMAMDDFGSGYSSLGMLKDLPVDIIKMDRSFFVNQKDAARSKVVLGSIIEMVANLGARVVAEGVEEQQHIDLLRELHCDMVQGYYYAKPMPAEAFTKILREPVKAHA